MSAACDHRVSALEDPVYPGNPLVIATYIMMRFSSLDEAVAPTGSGFAAALADCAIPGSGCHVNAAIETLKRGKGGRSIDAMIEFASVYWTHGRAGGHENNVAAGEDQAKRFEALFRSQAAAWFGLGAAEPTSC